LIGDDAVKPKVIMHNVMSLDGRLTGFKPDLGLYYSLAAELEADVHLVGSQTILAQEDRLPEDDDAAFQPHDTGTYGEGRMLVVPDSRGRIKRWHGMRTCGIWRDVVVLVSQSTPDDFLDFLEDRYITYLVAGKDHVNMVAGLDMLNKEFGAKTVMLDSGGTLNTIMLKKGLVDELSVIMNPCLAGKAGKIALFKGAKAINLKLKHVSQPDEDTVWLRFDVLRA
jgi:2,5-diamino-6-(ribosylamino)-4(3H)-pyrimidinone 5'-phosphate reductase